MSAETRIPLESLRRRAGGAEGRRYWKSLEELAGSQSFLDYLQREFPEHAAEWSDASGRRSFLKLMGASMALAGVTGCTRQPEEKIVPYVRQPEQIVPGKPLHYATALDSHGYAEGVLVESHMGRPTKIEGNPAHPASLGASGVHGQAEILQLYDPDRSQTVTERGEIRSWGAFNAALLATLNAQKALEGEGLRILTETVSSPSLAAQLREVLAAFPKARWHQYESVSRDEVRAGAELAFGEALEARYRFDAADVVLCLDADLVGAGPGHLRYVRELTRRRRPSASAGMNRIYVVESAVTPTGGIADHRLPLRPSEIETFARSLAAQLGLPVSGGEDVASGPHGAWLQALARDLPAHPGRTVVVVGDQLPAAVHALGHAINEVLGNLGSTVVLNDPVVALPEDERASLAELTGEMQAGKVDLLLILGGNPVYTAPADVPFSEALAEVNFRIHLGQYDDETSEYCDWHVPQAHILESWGDVRAFDGTVSIRQPLIAPLYGGRSAHEVLAALLERPGRTAYDVVRDYWSERLGEDFEPAWRRALHDGVVPDTAASERSASVTLGEWALRSPAAPPSGLEVALRADPRVHDGRFANNGWLQELPDPVTKLTWDNAAVVSPATAEALGVPAPVQTASGHATPLAKLSLGDRSAVVPVWIQPGQPDGVVGLSLGYGRQRAGRVGNGVGFDAAPFRSSAAPWFSGGARLQPSGETRILACTQDHWTIEQEQVVHERHLVRSTTLDEYREHPERIGEMGHTPDPGLTFYPPHPYPGHAWGMAVDMSACVGCNACVVACQAENNIPVVGREEVGRGREMHWIRIDRYYQGGLENPEAFNQPVMCQHCENAPCEVVCPVAATVHSDEGLNDMVYNRCVGTRYCSNNCPYKVRRFNFFLYQDWETPSLKLQRNPDVTVRSRGVMEKCSYCVQRINKARIESKNEGREIRDGDIQTACQQSCPAEAIVFGDVNDPESAVSRLKAEPRNYGLLADTGTRPRTSYLAAIRNPNPALAGKAVSMASADHHEALVGPGHTLGSVTDKISSIVLRRRTPKGWFVGFAISFLLLNALILTIAQLLFVGVGIWGVTIPVGWGFDIINFVWWIGIGHAGTLISAILLLLRQEWRTSINRFAEAMTLFAVACAAFYPVFHMGRPWVGAYWLFPYPNTMGLWPNFRSPLIWDVFAVTTYATVSALFWFVGLIPDMATLRDRAKSRIWKKLYGIVAMGWRGSASHWHNYETAYLLLAGLATPLVVSVHTVVSFDFAVSIVPGWHATIFPPYFVAGAIYAGFAMVLTLAIPLRRFYDLSDFITNRHLDNMAKVMLATGLIVGYGYMVEAFMAWYSASPYETYMMWNRMTGPYAAMYWALIVCNVGVINTLWLPALRRNVGYLFCVALVVSVGMWLERYVIIVTSLHRDHLPSSWGIYSGTIWDWSAYIGTIGLFFTLLFLFVRFLPAISIFEMRTILPEEDEA